MCVFLSLCNDSACYIVCISHVLSNEEQSRDFNTDLSLEESYNLYSLFKPEVMFCYQKPVSIKHEFFECMDFSRISSFFFKCEIFMTWNCSCMKLLWYYAWYLSIREKSMSRKSLLGKTRTIHMRKKSMLYSSHLYFTYVCLLTV